LDEGIENPSDADLIITLRNLAPDLIALWEAAEELSTRISDVRSEVPPSVRGLNDTLRTTLARLKEMKK